MSERFKGEFSGLPELFRRNEVWPTPPQPCLHWKILFTGLQGGLEGSQKTVHTSPLHTLLTFDEHLCGCGVWAVGVCSQTRVATCVVLKGLSNDQGVQLPSVASDLNVRTVVQLLSLTEPSAGQRWTGMSAPWLRHTVKQRLDAKQGSCYARGYVLDKSSVSVFFMETEPGLWN